LLDYGFRVVISPRFGEIFRGNAGKQGLLAAQCSREDVEALWMVLESAPGTDVTVDLPEQTVQAGGLMFGFTIDAYTRWRLLEGLDDIALSLRHAEQIAAFEARRPAWLPTTTRTE
jgi:3-isopropylmalate/(R)-2-methylmalate dehydratase small subunit